MIEHLALLSNDLLELCSCETINIHMPPFHEPNEITSSRAQLSTLRLLVISDTTSENNGVK